MSSINCARGGRKEEWISSSNLQESWLTTTSVIKRPKRRNYFGNSLPAHNSAKEPNVRLKSNARRIVLLYGVLTATDIHVADAEKKNGNARIVTDSLLKCMICIPCKYAFFFLCKFIFTIFGTQK